MTKKSSEPVEEVVIDEQTDDAIIDPPIDPGVDAPAPDPAPADLSDMVPLVYMGHAAKFTYGSITLLPGIPAYVPKEEAEGILTTPFEAVRIAAGSQLEE